MCYALDQLNGAASGLHEGTVDQEGSAIPSERWAGSGTRAAAMMQQAASRCPGVGEFLQPCEKGVLGPGLGPQVPGALVCSLNAAFRSATPRARRARSAGLPPRSPAPWPESPRARPAPAPPTPAARPLKHQPLAPAVHSAGRGAGPEALLGALESLLAGQKPSDTVISELRAAVAAAAAAGVSRQPSASPSPRGTPAAGGAWCPASPRCSRPCSGAASPTLAAPAATTAPPSPLCSCGALAGPLAASSTPSAPGTPVAAACCGDPYACAPSPSGSAAADGTAGAAATAMAASAAAAASPRPATRASAILRRCATFGGSRLQWPASRLRRDSGGRATTESDLSALADLSSGYGSGGSSGSSGCGPAAAVPSGLLALRRPGLRRRRLGLLGPAPLSDADSGSVSSMAVDGQGPASDGGSQSGGDGGQEGEDEEAAAEEAAAQMLLRPPTDVSGGLHAALGHS
jgi:hypothetical protein